MGAYNKYIEYCRRIGVAPASEEKYEQVAASIDSPRAKCAVCHRVYVKAFGEACEKCIKRGQAPRDE